MHRLTATDTPMVRYTRTIFPSYACNQKCTFLNDHLCTHLDYHLYSDSISRWTPLVLASGWPL